MTNTAFEKLEEYRKKNIELNNINDLIELLRVRQNNAPVQKLSDMPKGGSCTSSLDNIIIRIQTLEEMYIKKLDLIVDEQKEIENIICLNFDVLDRTILRKYYIEGKTWCNVANDLQYSERQIYNIRAKIIKKCKSMVII